MCGAGQIESEGRPFIERWEHSAWPGRSGRGTRGGVGWERDPREAWERRRQPMDRCGLGWVAHEQAGEGE
jgi:hypothetical protein